MNTISDCANQAFFDKFLEFVGYKNVELLSCWSGYPRQPNVNMFWFTVRCKSELVLYHFGRDLGTTETWFTIHQKQR